VVRAEDALNSCNLFAVDRAFIKACRDRPNEKDVLYLTDSNNASIKSEEHLRDSRVANAIAVIKLAIFSGNRVGEALYKLVEYVVSCPADTAIVYLVSMYLLNGNKFSIYMHIFLKKER
jgi:intergrase/recombinase